MLRTDLFLTTAARETEVLRLRAEALATELRAPVVPRRQQGISRLFSEQTHATRALVVQSGRLLLAHRDGTEFFYHPNLAFLRLGNLLQGKKDWLLAAADLQPGDSVLDCTLGYAGEATLMAHIVGDAGEVHGIEAVPELGITVREGLQTVVTEQRLLNAAMRRVCVVHLGAYTEYLRTCPDNRYDIVYFDPFFDVDVDKQGTLDALRVFGDHTPLSGEALAEAQRVARRAVIVKTGRWSTVLAQLGITEVVGSVHGRVLYGIVRVGN